MAEATGEQIHASVVGGDLRQLEHDDPSWALASRAAAHLVGGITQAPSPEEAAAVGGEALDLTCAHCELISFLLFDAPALADWLAIHERAGGPRLERGRVLHRLASGALGGLDETAALVESDAARRLDAASTVDAASMRAMVALAQGDYEGSLAHARRASRMARTEGLPAQEYLAHLCLARARRWQGRPSLAIRILTALERTAPAVWRPWIEWELVLSGGPEALEPATRPASALGRMLEHIAGDSEAGQRAIEVSAPSFAPIAAELRQLLGVLDPHGRPDPELPALLVAWQRGELHTLMPGYPGLCVPRRDDPAGEQHALAWVIAGPSIQPCRVPRAAIALLAGHAHIEQSQRRAGREDSALAVLALSRGRVSIADLFRAVYGFAYVPELHEGVLRVLLHRVRQRLEGQCSITTHEGDVEVKLEGTLLVPDPRCSRAADERVLLALARRGHASARDLASELGMPLRTVQAAVRDLVAEGACRAKTAGRRVEYSVEDTTFTEVTRF